MSDPRRWRDFAREDCRAARVSLGEGLFRPACFLAQQSVEKALKGFLLFRTGKYPKTHLLRELLSLCDLADPEFRQWVEDCHFLDRFYRSTRYPDAPPGSLPERDPTREDAQRTVGIAERLVQFVEGRISK
jgi:HEPN domain-containing protein